MQSFSPTSRWREHLAARVSGSVPIDRDFLIWTLKGQDLRDFLDGLKRREEKRDGVACLSPSPPATVRYVRQYPTFAGLSIKNIEEAHAVLFAVYSGLSHLLSRRLDVVEQGLIRNGDIYVWEDRKPVPGIRHGIERFRDGRTWSIPRRKGPFLYYTERHESVVYRTQVFVSIALDYVFLTAYLLSRSGCNPWGSEPLTKMTYSAEVDIAGEKKRWHINAYVLPTQSSQLMAFRDRIDLSNLKCPANLFMTTRKGKTRSSTRIPAPGESLFFSAK
ncbi:hypothetical protein C8J57DRAFT_1259064 [Mycena rebaudengoi]|nr:hypothetical protein C8J57DRAFT_1259064 [Mycena rebaudengoi]